MTDHLNMMDPFKIHASGVKKPLEEKNSSINNLYEH